MLDPQKLKKDFPIFEHQPDLVYLDSAATALKPRSVLEAMERYYREYSANAARGLYPIAETATAAVSEARGKVAAFIGAPVDSVIFTANATHGINLIAWGLRENLKPGDNLVVTTLEHHSNYLPWKEAARAAGAELRLVPLADDQTLSPSAVAANVDERTRLVACTAVSNVLGTLLPVQAIIAALRAVNPQALVLVDACQAVGHIPVSLAAWDADFLVFSGHKLFGPTGIGVLAGTPESFGRLGHPSVGGGMVLDALAEPSRYKPQPEGWEAGTLNIAGIVGLGAAIDFVQGVGLAALRQHEQNLAQLLIDRLQDTFGPAIRILGPESPSQRVGIVAFALAGIHPHDLASLLGETGICVRAGQHCTQPLHAALGLAATVRVSMSAYTTAEDIEKFVQTTQKSLAFISNEDLRV